MNLCSDICPWIIRSSNLTVFLKLCSQKTVRFNRLGTDNVHSQTNILGYFCVKWRLLFTYFLRQMEPGFCLCAHSSTLGLKRSHTSTVKMVALLLNAEESEDIRAAIMTAIIRPTIPTGRTFRTSLESKNNDCHAKAGLLQLQILR